MHVHAVMSRQWIPVTAQRSVEAAQTVAGGHWVHGFHSYLANPEAHPPTVQKGTVTESGQFSSAQLHTKQF